MKKFLLRIISTMTAFAFLGLGGCKATEPEGEVTVYMPDGAPALAFAKLMYEDTEEDGITYRVVNSSVIQSKVTNKEQPKNADLCVLPVTAAAKLLGDGSNYVLLGTVTHGNLFLIAKEKPAITAENVDSLLGKKVGVLQMNSVPGLTFKATLNKYGVAWQELSNDGTAAEDKVNLVAIADGSAVGALDADYFTIAEPAASAQATKGYSIVGNVQSLYGGENGYPQAVLVAKSTIAVQYREWLKSFVEKVENASAWLSETDGETLVSVVSAHLEDEGMQTSLKAPLLTKTAIEGCGIRFTYAANDYEEINSFLTAMLLVNESVTALPSEKFYWDYSK